MIDPNTPTPTTPQAPTTDLPTTPPKTSLSVGEAATMAEWAKEDLKAGKLTAEQAEKIFTELNVPLDQRGLDQRTDEQKTLDQHFPEASSEDYRINYSDPGQDPQPMTPQLKEFDQAARGWLAGAGFERNLGNSLVNAIAKTAQTTKGFSDAQLDDFGTREFAKLERVYGVALDEKLRSAGRMVEVLEKTKPGLKNLLRSNGIGDSALIASLLIQQAERYWAKHNAKQGR